MNKRNYSGWLTFVASCCITVMLIASCSREAESPEPEAQAESPEPEAEGQEHLGQRSPSRAQDHCGSDDHGAHAERFGLSRFVLPCPYHFGEKTGSGWGVFVESFVSTIAVDPHRRSGD